ncbi:MAG: hypothetical protein ACRCZS_13745, partial [Chroococcidiopsis sp.]
DDELINPTGLEIGSDGDIYISNKGFLAGEGEVLKLSLEEDASFNLDPIGDWAKYYGTTSGADGDPADVYSPDAFDYGYNTGGDLDPNVNASGLI